MDYTAAILTADPAGRAQARAALLRCAPQDAVDALGTLLLVVASDDAMRQMRHLSAMRSLRDALPPEKPSPS